MNPELPWNGEAVCLLREWRGLSAAEATRAMSQEPGCARVRQQYLIGWEGRAVTGGVARTKEPARPLYAEALRKVLGADSVLDFYLPTREFVAKYKIKVQRRERG